MARRSLGLLKNLGKWGLENTKKTVKEKAKKEASKLTPQHSGKENRTQVCNLKESNMIESLEKVTIVKMQRYIIQLF
jgi:hypothetical protein